MPLTETFNLTPMQPMFKQNNTGYGFIYLYGCFIGTSEIYTLDDMHSKNRVFFYGGTAGDRTLNYRHWSNQKNVPHIDLYYDLTQLKAKKEVVLVFSFSAETASSLLVYSHAGLLADETLPVGDNQFLLEVETLDPLQLFFIHVQNEGSNQGGNWFFNGISGHVI